MKIGSLFTGAGMLDEGVRMVLGGEVAWHVEFDTAASKVLAEHYPTIPNYGDVTNVSWADVEPIDVLTGGFPCQDVSSAGKRAGLQAGANRSGLWASMLDAIEALRPRLVVAENVRGLLSAKTDTSREVESRGPKGGRKVGVTDRALGRVLADMADVGYDAAWCGLRAADIGAPHQRFRVFIVAWPAQDAHCATRSEWREPASGEASGGWAWPDAGGRGGASTTDTCDGTAHREWSRPEPLARSAVAPHTEGDGRDEGWPEPARIVGGSDVAVSGTASPSDPSRYERRELDGDGGTPAWGEYGPAIRRWEQLTRVAPDPTEPAPRGGRRLSPRFTEWMQGWPLGWVDVEGVSRNDQLKICGNGVVPQQAAEALRRLMPFVAEHETEQAA